MKKIAYLVNQYPKVSHSFIRREIAALEAYNIQVLRFSIRSVANELVDSEDLAELSKTRSILTKNLAELLIGTLSIAIRRPLSFLAGFKLAWSLGQKGERGLAYHLVYLAEACTLLDWLEAAEVEHLHAHFGTNSTTVAMLCHRLGGPPFSFTVHGPEEFDKATVISLPEKIKQAAFVVAISSFGRSQVWRWTTYRDWTKVHVVRCGVDQSFLVEDFLPYPETPHFICVARLSEQKGHFLLLEAIKQLRDEGNPVKLTLVGDGEMRLEIEQFITTYGLTDWVSITGWASGPEVKSYMQKSTVLVLPSFGEGLPVVIMESLALGRPVISSSIAGIPELVQTGINGWLITPGSVESLTDAMRSALQCSPEQLEAMGKAGAEMVAKHHNSDCEASKLAELFSCRVRHSDQ